MNPQMQNPEPMLKESIKHFLTSYHSGTSDFTPFESIFFRLIQTMLDPPLEITWFYSAVTSHTAKSSLKNHHPSSKLLVAKDLFNVLTSCSNLSSARKKIALLAPLVCELYYIVCDCCVEDGVCAKREVEELVEKVVGYVMMCVGVCDYRNGGAEVDGSVVCFEDLVKVWTADRGGGSGCGFGFGESLRVFFPVLSDGVLKGMSVKCGVQELVGIVMCEVLFLKLCLVIRLGKCGESLLKDTQREVVQTVNGFRNYCFLVNMNILPMDLIHDWNPYASYDDLLIASSRYIIGECSKPVTDFSNLLSVFHRLVQEWKDPPLGIIWFYAAIKLHSSKPTTLPPPGQLLIAKNLLELLKSCSHFCSMVKKVAVIAPVLYLLYNLEVSFSVRDPCLREEIGFVVEDIVRYISICCSQYLENGEHGLDSLGVSTLDVMRVWTLDHVKASSDTDVLAAFFPILKSEFQQDLNLSLGYLAGVVMTETLFFRLFLKISSEINKFDLQKSMLNLAIQTIKGFQSFYFLDLLLKMMLEPRMPIADLLSPKDAILLHKALYDAVMLFDYSSYAGKWAHAANNRAKELSLLWVLVAERAIQFARTTSDQERAALFLNAFFDSQLVNELIKWAGIQAGSAEGNNRPEISTPSSLIKWLLVLEDQGIRVFDQNASKLCAKEVIHQSNAEVKSPKLHFSERHQSQSNCVGDRIDAKDMEMSDLSNNEFPVLNMTDMRIDAGRKRKEALGDQQSGVKHVKLNYFGTSINEKISPISDNKSLHYGSGAKNVASDDDMEIIG